MKRNSNRYEFDQLMDLYSGDMVRLRSLAFAERDARYDMTIFFNRNFHIEPSNVCIHNVVSAPTDVIVKSNREPGAWILTKSKIIVCKNIVRVLPKCT